MKEIQISHPDFQKRLILYTSPSKSIDSLYQSLHSIRIALNIYYDRNNILPPSKQLHYLVQTNILTHLPNNPYTENNSDAAIYPNINDWHYVNQNNTITLYAYTHPSHVLSWSL